jgi:hypothetical protein
MSIGATTALAGTFTDLTSTGNTTVGNADTDTITVNGQFVTGTQLKSAKTATNTLFLAAYDTDGLAYTNLITLTASTTPTLALTSTGVGTINNMSIGATTASTGAFTTLSATGAVTVNTTTNAQSYTTTGAGTITISSGTAGTINNMSIGATTALAGTFTALTATGAVTINTTTNAQSYTTTGAGTITISSGTAGTINNMSIGATTPLAGTFTTLTSTGNTTLGDAAADTITVNGQFVTGTILRSAQTATNTLALAAYDTDGAAYTNLITLTASTTPTLALTSTGVGTINNMSIGATTASTGAFTTLSATGAVTVNTTTNAQSYTTTGAGTITISSGTAGTINNMSIGATTALAGSFTALAYTTTLTGGTGIIAIGTNQIYKDATGKVGLGTASPAVTLAISATDAILIPKGTTAQQPTGVAGYLRFNTTTTQFEGHNGTAWASVGGAAISNDTTTATNVYPLFAAATSGTALTVYTGNAKLLYKPSTGEFTSSVLTAGNGIVVNSQSVATSYTIAAGYSGTSAGPITIASGQSVTVSSGSRWVVL